MPRAASNRKSNMYSSRLILSNVLAISFLWAGQSQEPVLRARIALAGSLREPPGLMKVRSHSIGGMAFSHSGKKLAAVAVGHSYGEQGLFHIVIADLDQPQPAIRSFNVSTHKDVWFPHQRLQWSENDDLLLFHNGVEDCILIDSSSGAVRCSISAKARISMLASGMVGTGQFFVAEGVKDDTLLSFYDFRCGLSFERHLKGRVSDGSTSSGPLIVLEHHLEFKPVISILRGPEWIVWKQLVVDRDRNHPVLLQNGRVLCAGVSANGNNGSVECWSIQDDAILARQGYSMRKGGTDPISSAYRSSLIAFLERSYSRGPFENLTVRPKRYVVWDVESAKTIAELSPRQYDVHARSESPYRFKAVFDIAISPDGALLVLGGDDTLEIYNIQR